MTAFEIRINTNKKISAIDLDGIAHDFADTLLERYPGIYVEVTFNIIEEVSVFCRNKRVTQKL